MNPKLLLLAGAAIVTYLMDPFGWFEEEKPEPKKEPTKPAAPAAAPAPTTITLPSEEEPITQQPTPEGQAKE